MKIDESGAEMGWDGIEYAIAAACGFAILLLAVLVIGIARGVW